MIGTIAPSLDRAEPPAPRLSALDRVRAFAQRPRRRALALILLVAAFADFYQLLRDGYANLYYAAAIKSMLESWHNFFFVSFDPGGFVSVDKPPLGFWMQAASAKLLGFSPFSILLPEALAGVISVGVLYLLVQRVFGTPAGLLAALLLALTPVSVVTNRNNTIDSLLVLTVLLAAYAVTRAAESGRLRWLLLGAALVGLGFNIKMLQAYLVLPAFIAVYLLGAPLGWWKRLWHLAAAGAVLLVISLSWVLAVDLTPASARPYVGSSGTNSELALAIGYNGLQRLLGTVFGVPSNLASGAAAASGLGGPGGVGENGARGVFRLLNAQLGGQASWLLALGLVGMLAAGWGLPPRVLLRALPERLRAVLHSADARRGAHLTPPQMALVLWGGWTLTQVVFFSVAGFFHSYYLSMLAPGVSALAGAGMVLLWRDYRAEGWRGWLLPLALVVTAMTQAVIVADYAGWNAWMTPLIVGGSLLVAAVLVWWRLGAVRTAAAAPAGSPPPAALTGPLIVDAIAAPAPNRARAGLFHWMSAPILATALGVAVLLVGPVTWSGVSLARGADGALPSAGPTTTLAQTAGGPGRGFPAGPQGGFQPGAFGAFGAPPSGAFPFAPDRVPEGLAGGPAARQSLGGQLNQANSQLVAYLEAHQGSTRYLFATLSSQTAAPYIIATGKPIMTLGGFTGADQILTVSQLQTLIGDGQVRFFLLSGGGFGFGGPGGGSGNQQLVQWIESHATLVPASAYGGSAAGGAQLYVIAGAGGS